MKKYRFYIIPAILLFMFLSSAASAREIALTLEYYRTDNKGIIDGIYIMELANEKQKQKLYDDLIIADEGSRRTLNELLYIFEWNQVLQLRNALTRKSRVFTSEFIVPESSISSQSVMLDDKELNVHFKVKARRNHTVPVGMTIMYDDRQLYFGIPKAYPMDRLVLLHDLSHKENDNEELEVLIIKIIHHKTEEPEDPEESGQ
jgi:hypothetical protein